MIQNAMSNRDKRTLAKEIEEKIAQADEELLERLLWIIDRYNGDGIGLVKEAMDSHGNSEKAAVRQLVAWRNEYDEGGNSDILPKEYRYASLDLCLIDAIFSIGVKYAAVQNAIRRYIDKRDIKTAYYKRGDNSIVLLETDSLNQFRVRDRKEESFKQQGEELAEELENRQRTSSTNGILKAQAVIECANILIDHEVRTIKDFREIMKKKDSTAFKKLEREFRSVKGQKSGISFEYLKMLCGDENTIKPDRHVMRFLKRFYSDEQLGGNPNTIVEEIQNCLKKEDVDLTLREIDYLIWSHMAGWA